MYDKSLDQIVGHQFYFNPGLGYTLPFMSWFGTTYNSSTLYGEQPLKPLSAPDLVFTTFDAYSNVEVAGL